MDYFKKVAKSLKEPARRKFMAETPCVKQVFRCVGKSVDGEGFGGTDGLELFRLTDSGVDREGDIIFSPGMDTEQWEQFGSVLWGHSAATPDLVLGAPAEVIRNDSSIDALLRFATEDENPTGALVSRMIRAGIVQAGSVGIIIKEFSEAPDRDGFWPINILGSELMEFSITPIPANPRAVRQEFPSEEDQKDIVEVVERTVEEVCEVTEQEKDWAVELLRDLSGNPVSVSAAQDPLTAFVNRLAKGE